MFHVVTGGSGSGKSAYAEEQICMLKKKTNSRHLYYIATMVPYGKETEQKILRHRQMRNGKGFETLECFTDLKKLVQTEPGFRADAAEEGICVLLECMSNLVANEMFQENGAHERTVQEILKGVKSLLAQAGNLVIVTNEIFSEAASYEGETETYQKYLGKINQELAHLADEVVEVVYGIPVYHKKSKGGTSHEKSVE